MLNVLPKSLSSTRLARLGREFFWVLSGQIVAVLGGMIGVRWLTGALRPTAYGELALGLTAATFVQQLIMGPLAMAGLRFFSPAQEFGHLGSFLEALRNRVGAATALVSAIAGGVSVVLAVSGRGAWLWLELGAVLFALLSGYSEISDAVLNAARQRLIVAWQQGLTQWLRPLFAIGVVAVLGATSRAAMLGFVLASIILVTTRLVILRKTLAGKFRKDSVTSSKVNEVDELVGQMSRYAWPFAAWGIFTWLRVVSDRWGLEFFRNTQSVGMYVVVYQLGYTPMLLMSQSISQFVAPVLFSRVGNANDSLRLKDALRLNSVTLAGTMFVMAFAVMFAFVFHAQIFAAVAAPEYRHVSRYLPVLALSGGLFGAGQIASIVALIGAETRRLVFPTVVTAVLGVGLNFAGAYARGMEGVIFASLAFSAIYFAWMISLARSYKSATRVMLRT